MNLNYENIPALMREAPYVLTKNKIPMNFKTGKPASFKDKQNHICFEEAVRIAAKKNFQIGLVLLEENNLTCIDIDNCVDDTGKIAPEVMEIIERINSYTEFSRSGKGIHIFVLGKKTQDKTYNKDLKWCKCLEIYDKDKQIVITGNVLPGYEKLIERPDELKSIELQYFAPKKNEDYSIPDKEMSDEEFIKIGLKRDKVFREYYNGARKNNDESRDDFALIGKCMYWANNNTAVALDTFFKSPHVQQKDPMHVKKINRNPYILSIINKFIGNKTARDDRKFLTKDFIENKNKILMQLQKLKPETFDFTDVGNAELFNKVYGDRLLYNITSKGWMYYGK